MAATVLGRRVSDEEASLRLKVGLVDKLLFEAESTFFRFRREDCSFSARSITSLAMRQNSAQIPSIRCTPPCSASWPSMERKVTTRSINRVSDLARGSNGFCRMLLKRVMRAETGK